MQYWDMGCGTSKNAVKYQPSPTEADDGKLLAILLTVKPFQSKLLKVYHDFHYGLSQYYSIWLSN